MGFDPPAQTDINIVITGYKILQAKSGSLHFALEQLDQSLLGIAAAVNIGLRGLD